MQKLKLQINGTEYSLTEYFKLKKEVSVLYKRLLALDNCAINSHKNGKDINTLLSEKSSLERELARKLHIVDQLDRQFNEYHFYEHNNFSEVVKKFLFPGNLKPGNITPKGAN